MRTLTALLASVALLAIGCGEAGDDADPWTDDVRESFMTACQDSSGGETAYCQCVLDELEGTYTLAEFETIEQDLDEGGELPAELEAIIQRCIEEHIA